MNTFRDIEHENDVETPPTPTTDANNELPIVLTVDEVAELLRVARSSIYTAIRDCKLPGAIHVGKTLRVSRVAVMDWLRGGGTLTSGDAWREPPRDSDSLVAVLVDRARLALSALDYGRVDLARKHIGDVVTLGQGQRVSRKRPRQVHSRGTR